MKYKSYSKEHQDLFVLAVTNSKRNGTYFEVGSGNPVSGSNTYLLETEFGWTGVSLEIVDEDVRKFKKIRKNKCFCLDAANTDLTDVIFKNKLGNHIDFLQLDIDPYFNTFKALNNINFDKVSFSVVTYEHDAYKGGTKEREASRSILMSKGYSIVMADVCFRREYGNSAFEDWYINEKYMTSENWRRFCGENIVMNSPYIKRHNLDKGVWKLLEEMI